MILNDEINSILEELKAEDIISLNVKNKSSVTDTMIIASGRSTRHVKSISDNIIKKLKKTKIKPIGIEGYSKSEWILIDFGDVLVHTSSARSRRASCRRRRRSRPRAACSSPCRARRTGTSWGWPPWPPPSPSPWPPSPPPSPPTPTSRCSWRARTQRPLVSQRQAVEGAGEMGSHGWRFESRRGH